MSIRGQQVVRKYEQRQADLQARKLRIEQVIVCAIFSSGILLVLAILFWWE